MLGDGRSPHSEPVSQRSDQPLALEGVTEKGLPLVSVRLAGLVQYRSRDTELADVMKQSGPPKPISVGRWKIQLFGDEVGECSDAFGVPARHAIVLAERSCESKDALGGDG
jgi:hypothetical protein